MFIAPIVCIVEIKDKIKLLVTTKVSAEMAPSHHDGSFPIFFFFLPPIPCQYCSSSRLVFFLTKLLISCWFFLCVYFIGTNRTMSTTSFCKTTTIHGVRGRNQIHLQLFTRREFRGHWEEKKKTSNILYFTFRKSPKQSI